MLKKFQIDLHVCFAAAGGITSFIVDHFNGFMAGCIAVATFTYIGFKAAREGLKFFRDWRKTDRNENDL